MADIPISKMQVPGSNDTLLLRDSTAANKVQSATNDHLAALDANGNLKDSGIAKTDIEDIQDKTDTSLSSISGNPISISNLKSTQLAVDPVITFEPIQDLHGQSKPYPAGGGKNLLPLTVDGIKAANTSGTWSGNVYTTNNIAFTILTDVANNVTGIKVNGTSNGTARLYFSVSSFTSNTIFSLSSDKSSGTTIPSIYVTNMGTSVSISSSLNIPANTTLGNTFINIGSSGVSVDNVTVYPMIRLATESDATFAPYSNICPISGYDKIEVLSCGRNVIEGWNQGSWSQAGTDSGSTTRVKSKALINTLGNGTYVLSASTNVSGKQQKVGVMGYTYSNGAYTNVVDSGWQALGYTFTAQQGLYYGFQTSFSDNSTITPSNVTGLWLEYGSTVSSYEPYHKTTDLSESLGQTVYKGSLDVRTGLLTVTYGIVDLGDLTYSYNSSMVRYLAVVSGMYEYRGNLDWICSCYETSLNAYYDADRTNNVITLDNSGLLIRDNRYTSASDLKAALVGQKLVYKLATPFTIQLTPHEIALSQGYAYISTNGTLIALDYHNGEMASLGDVEELYKTVERNIIRSQHAYSTTEQVVGTWIDGKPLYEITAEFSSEITVNSNTWTNTTIPTTNKKTIVNVIGMSSTGTCWNMLSANRDNGSYVQVYHSRNTSIPLGMLTIQYTKITD